MAVEKAPYINYNEVSTYYDEIQNGSEISLWIVKTNNVVTLSDITASKIKRIKSYTGFKEEFSISDDEKTYASLPTVVKELDKMVEDFFEENSMYGSNSNYGLSSPYIYMIDVGNNPTVEHYKKALQVSEVRRNSTAIAIPNVEDVAFMKEVKQKIREETKGGLLRISYFGVSGQGELEQKFAKGTCVIPTLNADTYTGVVEAYKKDNKLYATYDGDEEFTDEITLETGKIYIDRLSVATNDYAYEYKNNTLTNINVVVNENKLCYENDDNYKLIIPSTKKSMGGVDETFDEYCNRLQYISQEVQSSRVAIVEKKYFGKIIAKICSTPYHIEPGYIPYLSVNQGVFGILDEESRDKLFGTGLIFNEDDYTLASPTPRICIGSSTAWGVEDHDMRVTDSLLHARRNVDHHIRRILRIIAPQLKRNETSVNLRHIKTAIDLYLDSELSNGTIQEYDFTIEESSYNPYALLIRGRITPVNSTLAIEFENTVGSPYAIASDYV